MSGEPSGLERALEPAHAEVLAAELEAGIEAVRPPYVIDTSVAVKWYIPEVLSAGAKLYMEKSIDRHAPDYLPAEAASVVLKRVRTRDPESRLSLNQGRMVLAALKTAPIQFHASLPLIDPSFALAAQVGASLYDGLFLALALQLGAQLVTADHKLFKKVQASPHAAYVRWVEVGP